MPAQVNIFRRKDVKTLTREINSFLCEKGLKREQVTIKQSESYGDQYRNYTITLLYDEE